jgi:hypothetical protein
MAHLPLNSNSGQTIPLKYKLFCLKNKANLHKFIFSGQREKRDGVFTPPLTPLLLYDRYRYLLLALYH